MLDADAEQSVQAMLARHVTCPTMRWCANCPHACGRYVDMIVTEGVIDTFRARSLVNSTIRRFLEDKEFLEARG